MRRTLMMIAALSLLGGCATPSEPKPAVCDGKHRRPANPYGSVLPSIPGAGAAITPPSPPPPPAKPPAEPGPRSSVDPTSFGPCGRLA